jgi:hypothetical protein
MSIDQVLRNELTPQQYAAAVDPALEVLCLARIALANSARVNPSLWSQKFTGFWQLLSVGKVVAAGPDWIGDL